jgi:hypothetical protein
LTADAQREGSGRCRTVTNRHALEHTRNAQNGPIEARESVQDDAQAEDRQRATQHLDDELTAVGPALHVLDERQGDRDADDEQEEREDEVGRRPAVPGGMAERPVHVAPRTGIVHQNHPGNGDPAECVEREQALGAGR